MRTEKEIKQIRKRVINRYMDGNLHRFLRIHQKQATFEAVFTKYISEWKKHPKRRQIVKQLFNKLIWPKPIVDVVNIMRTLYMYYEYEYDENGARVAWEIYQAFEYDIEKYNKEKYFRWIQHNGFDSWPKLTPTKALKEQKARGFVNVNNFEDFDTKACHVQSIVNDDYVYPMNFYLNKYPKDHERKRGPYLVYIGQDLTGVKGYTRCRIPKHYVN